MLPDLIEVSPPRGQKESKVVLPGSKSLTNRALILAALASAPVCCAAPCGARTRRRWSSAWSGWASVSWWRTIRPSPPIARSRSRARGGRIPNAGTPDKPLELFVENAGTAARFLPPMLCLGHGSYRVSGIERMHQRPQAALVAALRQLGYRIDTPNDRLPAVIHGTGPRPGAACSVSVEESSQFASALLLSAGIGGWQVSVTGANEDELPYVDMTRRLVKDFPWNGGTYGIEADASGASYFWGADWLLRESGSRVTVVPTPQERHAGRPEVLDLVAQGPWRPAYSRQTDLADSIMTAIVLAPFAPATTRFTDLGRLRVQECERVKALRTELTKCGARVEESGDTLTIHPGPLHGAEIETYNDHRIAMCFGMLGLRVPGMRLSKPACVRKTFPNFFAKLAELGTVIKDADGKPLSGEELLA